MEASCILTYMTLVIIALMCLAFFIVHWFHSINRFDGQSEWEDLRAAYNDMMAFQSDVGKDLATIAQRTELGLSEYILTQLLQLCIVILVYLIVIVVWFFEDVLANIVAIIMGAAIIPLMSFFASRYTTRALSRGLIYTSISKEDSFEFLINCGYSVMFFFVSCIIIGFLICSMFVQYIIGSNLKKYSTCMMNFSLGMIIAGFLYRESVSLFSRGLKTGTIGLIKSENNLHLDNNSLSKITKQVHLAISLVGQTLVNYLDTAIIISTLIVVGMHLLQGSTEITDAKCPDIQLMSPGFIIILTTISSTVAFLLKVTFVDDETAWFIAVNIRWAIIAGSISSLMIVLILPLMIFKEGFTLDQKVTSSRVLYFFTHKNKQDCRSCGLLGLISNILIICLFEWFTSHGFSPVRNMSQSSVPRIPSMHLIYSIYLGGVSGYLPLMVLVFGLYISVYLAGLAGALFFTAGFLSIILIVMPIYFVGAGSSDSYRLACFASLQEYISDRGAILLCATVIGKLMGEFKIDALIGCIIGVGSAFFVRGVSVCAVINIAKDYVNDIRGKEGFEQNDDGIYDLFHSKYVKAASYVMRNWGFLTLVMILTGYWASYQTLIGFMIGFLTASCEIMFCGIIRGVTLENSRIFNDSAQDKDPLIYQNYVSGDAYGAGTEESNATPIIIYLLYVCIFGYGLAINIKTEGKS